MSFKYRKQRGTLSESMKAVKEFHSRSDFVKYLQNDLDKEFGIGELDLNEVKVKKYSDGFDERIGWDTHVVYLDGYGVLGFTDAPV